MLDENGNWIPDDPYQPPLLSQAQKTAKEVYGIGSSGPMAEQATATANDFNAGRHESFDRLGQNAPQQYGMAETTDNYTDDLKTPQQAVEGFMANNYTPDSARRAAAARQRGPETPEQILARNSAYQEKAAGDRALRDTERNRLREQGFANRAADREKDADMWSQFRDMGSLQGATRPAQFNGGPMVGAQNVGGAILLPGMGAPPGGRYGRGFDPYAADKIQLRRDEFGHRVERDATNAANAAERNNQYGAKTAAQIAAEAGKQARFDTGQLVKRGATAEEQRDELGKLMAEFTRRDIAFKDAAANGASPEEVSAALDASAPKADPRNPGKTIAGVPFKGSYGAIGKRIIEIARQLNDAHNQGAYSFELTPEDAKMIRDIQRRWGGDRMETP